MISNDIDVVESFEFQMPEYTQATVIRLLMNYIDIRMALIDRMPRPTKIIYTNVNDHHFRERPKGASSSLPWPFMTKPRAQTHTDGKKRARMMEDLHAAAIDLEQGLQRLTDDEYHLLADYYIFGSGTIMDLAEARGLASKGRLQERIQRTVKKLVRVMNNE